MLGATLLRGEVPTDLVGGPHDGRRGAVMLGANGEPPKVLTFMRGLAVYVRDERCTKIKQRGEDGRVRRVKGARYVYDKDSPLERRVAESIDKAEGEVGTA